MIRKDSKIKTLNAQKKKETTPNSKDELDIITVGQPHTITSPEEVESTLPKNSDPSEQLAH